jgi:hypothetical protein
METQNQTLIRRRAKTVDPRGHTERRLTHALMLLRIYMKQSAYCRTCSVPSPDMVDLNRRTANWMKRHANDPKD